MNKPKPPKPDSSESGSTSSSGSSSMSETPLPEPINPVTPYDSIIQQIIEHAMTNGFLTKL